jgi:hypothetical protein
MAAADLAHDPRHERGLAGAAGDRRRVLDVDAAERGREAVGVALAAHLAVGDDVDPSALHVADREQRRVILRLLEPGLGDAPDFWHADARHGHAEARPVDQPVGLRVAADHRGRQEARRHPSVLEDRNRAGEAGGCTLDAEREAADREAGRRQGL